MKRDTLSTVSRASNVTTPRKICKETEVIDVIQGFPLLYTTNDPSPLPIPASHEDFLYRFSIDFQGGKLRHLV